MAFQEDMQVYHTIFFFEIKKLRIWELDFWINIIS